MCAHAWKCGVYLHSPPIPSHIPSFPLDLIFLSQSPVTCISYIYAYYDIYHICVYNMCKHKSMYRNEDEYLSFWIWLILSNMMLSSFIHLWMVLFFAATYNPFIHKPHFPYPFVYCWVSGSILYLDYCHSAAVATDVLVFWFELFCVCASRGTARSYANSVFSVSEEPPHWFP